MAEPPETKLLFCRDRYAATGGWAWAVRGAEVRFLGECASFEWLKEFGDEREILVEEAAQAIWIPSPEMVRRRRLARTQPVGANPR